MLAWQVYLAVWHVLADACALDSQGHQELLQGVVSTTQHRGIYCRRLLHEHPLQTCGRQGGEILPQVLSLAIVGRDLILVSDVSGVSEVLGVNFHHS